MSSLGLSSPVLRPLRRGLRTVRLGEVDRPIEVDAHRVARHPRTALRGTHLAKELGDLERPLEGHTVAEVDDDRLAGLEFCPGQIARRRDRHRPATLDHGEVVQLIDDDLRPDEGRPLVVNFAGPVVPPEHGEDAAVRRAVDQHQAAEDVGAARLGRVLGILVDAHHSVAAGLLQLVLDAAVRLVGSAPPEESQSPREASVAGYRTTQVSMVRALSFMGGLAGFAGSWGARPATSGPPACAGRRPPGSSGWHWFNRTPTPGSGGATSVKYAFSWSVCSMSISTECPLTSPMA